MSGNLRSCDHGYSNPLMLLRQWLEDFEAFHTKSIPGDVLCHRLPLAAQPESASEAAVRYANVNVRRYIRYAGPPMGGTGLLIHGLRLLLKGSCRASEWPWGDLFASKSRIRQRSRLPTDDKRIEWDMLRFLYN